MIDASWLCAMEKYIDAWVMASHDRIAHVAFQIKGTANVWWKGVCAAWRSNDGAPTWDVLGD